MTFRAIALAALLTVSGASSAQDLLYTYTGNVFTANNITGPSRVVAHFIFDFANSPQAAQGIYNIKHWDISAAGLNFGPQYAYTDAEFYFTFSNGQVSSWDMWVMNGQLNNSAMFSTSNPVDAADMVLEHIYAGNGAWSYVPGTWSVAPVPSFRAQAITAVPEPSTWLMLGAGAAVLLGARRRQARTQA